MFSSGSEHEFTSKFITIDSCGGSDFNFKFKSHSYRIVCVVIMLPSGLSAKSSRLPGKGKLRLSKKSLRGIRSQRFKAPVTNNCGGAWDKTL